MLTLRKSTLVLCEKYTPPPPHPVKPTAYVANKKLGVAPKLERLYMSGSAKMEFVSLSFSLKPMADIAS